MTIDLTPIFQAFIALLAALITYKLVPWIRARTTESQQANMRAVVKALVYAAEQIYGAGKGKEKLKYVRARLAAKGFDVDTDEIEAAVAEYLNREIIFYDGDEEDDYDDEYDDDDLDDDDDADDPEAEDAEETAAEDEEDFEEETGEWK